MRMEVLLPHLHPFSLHPFSFVHEDVVTIEKTNENFRLLFDTKGRYAVHRITPEEAKVRLGNF
jgi:ribosomal protein S4E